MVFDKVNVELLKLVAVRRDTRIAGRQVLQGYAGILWFAGLDGIRVSA